MATFLHAPRRRRAFFMLTPLVDIMFLLLIFFMLTSQTSLFTLVRISAQGGAPEAQPSAPVPVAAAELLVSIGRDQVRINGRATLLGELPAALAAYKARGIVRAALVPGLSARVQDIVTVLELFEAARFSHVRLVSAEPSP